MAKIGYSDVVVGLQFGDEGKARIVDYLASKYDIIARFNGGSNAGHTIEHGKVKIGLQQIPSGILYPNKQLYIGSGCVVNLEKLVKELSAVETLGIKLDKRLRISCQASIIQPHHIVLDEIMGGGVGTTRNGIGPAYSDKAIRMDKERLVNIRIADLIDEPEHYLTLIKNNFLFVLKEHNLSTSGVDKTIENMRSALKDIRKFIELDPLFLQKKVEKGARVLFEGAQSAMLDITRGSVPYVTSSNTIAPAAYVGGDLPVKYHRKTIGIAKAIMSRVGHGPFTSEFGGKKSEEYCMDIKNGISKHTRAIEKTYDVKKLLKSPDDFKLGMALRIFSGEYGTVTGRPRRIGIFDLIQLSYMVKVNGVDEIIINKCDVLNVYAKTKKNKMPMVNTYKLDNKKIDYVPSSINASYRVKPGIVYLDSFSEDISNIRSFDKLPIQLKEFIKMVEEFINAKVVGIGVGPERDQFIYRS